MTAPRILVAGAAGDLGTRLTTVLIERGADVRALVRHDASAAAVEGVRALGATPVSADVTDTGSWSTAVAPGADLRVDLPAYRVWKHGSIVSEPGVVTAIAGRSRMMLDLRHLDANALATMLAE